MFTLSDDETMLREGARDFADRQMPVSFLRAQRDAGVPGAFDPARWQQIAELGWTGALVAEAQGGSGLPPRALIQIIEMLGATLAPVPLTSTALAAVPVLSNCPDAHLRDQWLGGIATGSIIAALAVDEGPRHAPRAIATTLSSAGLSGRKQFVADASAATLLLVTALRAGEPVLAVVEAGAPGVTRQAAQTFDARGATEFTFANVQPAVILGGWSAIETMLDHARVGVAAEMLGAADRLFHIVLDYLRTRRQFDRPIGSFQALQHRAAEMFIDLELTRSAVAAAAHALGETDDARLAVSIAKARAAATIHLVTNETIQMHGGIGMTDAHDAGLYLKRARVLEALYGNAAFHRNRFAELKGF